jgi:hypothetical protein
MSWKGALWNGVVQGSKNGLVDTAGLLDRIDTAPKAPVCEIPSIKRRGPGLKPGLARKVAGRA